MAGEMPSSWSPNIKTDARPRVGSSEATKIGGSEQELSLREADWRLKQAEMLLNVSRRLAAIESLNEVLATIVEIIALELKAERGSLFLNDPVTGELCSRAAQGNLRREIRLLNSSGIVGHVFSTGAGVITKDAYLDDRFDPTIDEQTGFKTKSICCAPMKTVKGDIIGVIQCLNKIEGEFNQEHLELLETIGTQAASYLQSTRYSEQMKTRREQEMKFLDMVSDVTSELELDTLLKRVMEEATRMLNADRSTLFLNDEKTEELFSRFTMGERVGEIRLPNHTGIAGKVFTSGKSVIIPHAYADLLFNPALDKQTGYFTRSILCVPVVNKAGKVIGVTQVLNKRGGPFIEEDETRLKAFSGQVSVALENAKLFDDVQNMKNYSEAMLQSMSNGVITIDEDERIVTCNAAGQRIVHHDEKNIVGKRAEEFFIGPNAWVTERLRKMRETQESDVTMDQVIVFGDETVSVNVSFLPLFNVEGKKLGSMVMIEDISSEKRLKSTMSRYMDPGIVDQLLEEGEDILGGQNMEATILFSDIRGFTTLSEMLGPQGTVAMLNEYFTIMVDCITQEGGMLDKFIGDATMAAFGVPLPHDDDADRALRAAISMLNELDVWNKQRITKGQPEIHMGIGLNTDTIVAGNIGSPKRMDYTMIGDGVNLAARLESACKQYSAEILISEFTYERLKGTYRMRDVDKVVVKGKTEPVRMFEVLEHYNEETFPNIMEAVSHFKNGRDQYDNGEWDKATTAFKEAFSLNPDDKLAEIYIHRCEQLKTDPPKDWNGIWVMTAK